MDVKERKAEREHRSRSVVFRARKTLVTREGPDSIHLHFFTDAKKRVTFALPRSLALSTAGILEASTF